MNKYLFIYRTPPMDTKVSPEEMQQQFARWGAWRDKFKGQVVDMGDGLENDGKVLSGAKVSDGFPEAKEIVGGFSVIQAETYDDALRVARECPIAFIPDSSIEIRKMMGY